MKGTCNIIHDLLPLYVEDMVTEETKQMIEEHLVTCKHCKEELHKLNFTLDIPILTDTSAMMHLEKKMKRRKWLTLLLIFALVVSSLSIFAHTYKQSMYWKNQTAERNYNNWTTLYHMTTKLDKTNMTEDFLKMYSLYVNGIVQSTTTGNLMPAFNGGSVNSFLGTYYNALLQSLVYDDLKEEKRVEGIELFTEINTDLVVLCEFVLEKAESEHERCQLVEPDSELYEEIEEKIQEFCDRYDEKIDTFYTK